MVYSHAQNLSLLWIGRGINHWLQDALTKKNPPSIPNIHYLMKIHKKNKKNI